MDTKRANCEKCGTLVIGNRSTCPVCYSYLRFHTAGKTSNRKTHSIFSQSTSKKKYGSLDSKQLGCISCIIFALLGALLIGIAHLDQKRFILWFVLGLIPFVLLLWGSLTSCSKCGTWWTSSKIHDELLERWTESKDVKRKDITRNPEGEIISTTERIEQVIINVEKREHHYFCQACQAKNTVIKEYRDRDNWWTQFLDY